MFKIQSTKQLAAAVLATGCFTLALGAQAAARPDSMGIKAAGFDSAACKSAKLSASFDRQLHLAGDFMPGATATPPECVMTPDANAAVEATPAKQFVATAKAPHQAFPGGYEGVNLGGG
jgi:hypothetical protein